MDVVKFLLPTVSIKELGLTVKIKVSLHTRVIKTL